MVAFSYREGWSRQVGAAFEKSVSADMESMRQAARNAWMVELRTYCICIEGSYLCGYSSLRGGNGIGTPLGLSGVGDLMGLVNRLKSCVLAL